MNKNFNYTISSGYLVTTASNISMVSEWNKPAKEKLYTEKLQEILKNSFPLAEDKTSYDYTGKLPKVDCEGRASILNAEVEGNIVSKYDLFADNVKALAIKGKNLWLDKAHVNDTIFSKTNIIIEDSSVKKIEAQNSMYAARIKKADLLHTNEEIFGVDVEANKIDGGKSLFLELSKIKEHASGKTVSAKRCELKDITAHDVKLSDTSARIVDCLVPAIKNCTIETLKCNSSPIVIHDSQIRYLELQPIIPDVPSLSNIKNIQIGKIFFGSSGNVGSLSYPDHTPVVYNNEKMTFGEFKEKYLEKKKRVQQIQLHNCKVDKIKFLDWEIPGQVELHGTSSQNMPEITNGKITQILA